jgi:hypothetical protein
MRVVHCATWCNMVYNGFMCCRHAMAMVVV